MQNAPNDPALRDKLITFLQDAYSMENHLVDVLERQVKDVQKYPNVLAGVQRHLEETRQHRQRIEQCLQAYNKKPSGIKSLLSNLMGSMQGGLSGARTDALAMTARDDYVAEHFEIATYGLLIATAQLCGDQRTVQVCEQNLRDEIRMAQWLQQNLVEVGVTALREDGITIPPAALQSAQSVVQSALQPLSMPPGQVSGTQPAPGVPTV